MFKGWSNIVTFGCILIAGFVEAGEQALKDAPTVAALFPAWISGRLWNYVPLTFLIVAGISWAIGKLMPNRIPEAGSEHAVGSSSLIADTVARLNPEPISNVAITVGLTLDSAELDIATNDADPNPGFKCKLRVYWTNDGDETIHLGKPLWRGAAIQGNELVAHYQLRQFQNAAIPWGDETEEADVTPGRRCRIWIGLDPALRGSAAKLLDAGQLGLLTVPVTTPKGTVDVCIRPRDRGLRVFNAREYNELKKAFYDRYVVLSQDAKALLSFICARRILSPGEVAAHFQRYEIPNAEKTLADLQKDSVPFLDLSGSDLKLNPVAEKIIREMVKADEAEFLKAVDNMTGKALEERINNDSGFKGRFNALGSKQPW